MKNCDICGKPTESGVDHPDAKVYHRDCAYNLPEMQAVRELVKKACPEKVKKDV